MSQDQAADTGSSTTPAAATGDATISTIVVPITVTARFLERTLDDVLDGLVPEESGLLYQHRDLDLGHGFTGTAQVWRRSNTHVVMAGDAINATLPVRIVILPTWKPHLGPLSLPMDIALPLDISAEYTVRMQARPQLDPGYELRLHATFSYEVDRPVGIEAAGIDLTLAGATRLAAEKALAALGNWLNSDRFHYLNFRPQAERGWHALQQPLPLSQEPAPEQHIRLEVAPIGVHAQPFRTQGETGILGLVVVARIRALASALATTAPAALPPISASTAPSTGVNLELPLEMPFAALRAVLHEHITNHPWHIDGRHVLLRAIHVSGNDAGALRVRVDIAVTSASGDREVEAILSASGKPRLDIEQQHLSLDDFHYEAHTDSTLLNIAATLLRPFAGTVIEPWLNIPLAPQAQRLLAEVNTRLASGIAMGEGVTLHGKAAGLRLTNITVQAHGLAVMVKTQGELSISIDHAG